MTAGHSYEDDLIVDAHPIQRGFMKGPGGARPGRHAGRGCRREVQGDARGEWARHLSVVTFPGGIKHYYRNLQQAERLMKEGVDESFAPGVRLDEWEDDGSEAFDGLWRRLQAQDWPVVGLISREVCMDESR